MKFVRWVTFLAASTLAISIQAFPATPSTPESGQTLVTILPKSGPDFIPAIPAPESLQLKIDGKETPVTSVTRAQGPADPIELVVLIDSAARGSIGNQLPSIKNFAKELPANTRMAVAYMANGRAVFSGPLSSDPAQIAAGIKLPPGPVGVSGSPYFCLSDLARHWPSQDKSARREVVLISDGIDNYQPRYDPDDPYVQAAINDSIRAGLTVYSIYWKSQGELSRSPVISSGGQNLLQQVTDATGGYSYWQGLSNPVSFDPYFKDLRVRFEHQYRIRFQASGKNKPEVLSMKLKLSGTEAKLSAPQRVLVGAQTTE